MLSEIKLYQQKEIFSDHILQQSFTKNNVTFNFVVNNFYVKSYWNDEINLWEKLSI